MINFRIIGNVIGAIIFIVGAFMVIPTIYAFYLNESSANDLLTSSLIGLGVGFLLWRFTRSSHQIVGKRDGYLIVAGSWFVIGLFAALPYYLGHTSSGFSNALFESISGLTTTGATTLNDIESVPHGILLWRSMTQWIGGMGVIVLTVAILPLLGVGGVELFVAEAPGPTSNKIHPRIKETAKRLWLIYVGLTFTLMSILILEGMSLFDSVNHALTTIATGGFSTKNASIAAFDSPMIEYTIMAFMFVAGTSYTLLYFGFRGKFIRFWRSDEWKAYLAFTLIMVSIVGVGIYMVGSEPVEYSFRTAGFQVISVITTTGYITADYTAWSPSITALFFLLLFVGGCAGSTAGGIKIIRHLVFAKNSWFEFKRLLHPYGLIRLRLDDKIVAPRILTHVLVFLLIYLFVFVTASLLLSMFIADIETPLITAAGAVATCLGNVGPAIGAVGPVDTFFALPAEAKMLLCFVMILGRLELFSVLIIFTPAFWRD